MSRPAVPQYIGQNFNDCPPGHRFNLYFPIWRADWSADNNGKAAAIRECTAIPSTAKNLLAGLLARQRALAEASGALVLEAKSLSPFATGLGLEHPVENGFAFLSPYGLPYLAGSGAKGVFRKAAEELTCEDNAPLTLTDVDALFGPEDNDNARRSALAFWDVFPDGPAMSVEIMTPHHSGYYQNGGTPNDAGQPNPIPFLAIPHGAKFRFVVQCDERRLPEALVSRWKETVTAIFTHACDWRGFGAKTAVGYGALAPLTEQERAVAAAQAQQCPWVETQLTEIAARNNATPEDTLRGKALAEAWQSIAEAGLKAAALADIQRRWQAEGWWDNPPGKASRQAKAIYTTP
ncbi:MAG: type III-B CRISPR module RAMP protein Cmr6 [Rhodocyclaceae bacterium]|nr:type III-B CRISPR module RAMP protein Cmr6 [Rhodocyclaceae bacterium]